MPSFKWIELCTDEIKFYLECRGKQCKPSQNFASVHSFEFLQNSKWMWEKKIALFAGLLLRFVYDYWCESSIVAQLQWMENFFGPRLCIMNKKRSSNVPWQLPYFCGYFVLWTLFLWKKSFFYSPMHLFNEIQLDCIYIMCTTQTQWNENFSLRPNCNVIYRWFSHQFFFFGFFICLPFFQRLSAFLIPYDESLTKFHLFGWEHFIYLEMRHEIS